MSRAVAVSVTAFGQGRYNVEVPAASAFVGEVLRTAGIDVLSRRVAVNGASTRTEAGVSEGDEITVMPLVEGG